MDKVHAVKTTIVGSNPPFREKEKEKKKSTLN